MATDEGGIRRIFEQLGRQQLEVFARELQEHVRTERRLRHEERNRLLEQRVREVMALNELFLKHLNERFAVVEAYRRVLQELQSLPDETRAVLERAQSQPLPDPGETLRGLSTDTAVQ